MISDGPQPAAACHRQTQRGNRIKFSDDGPELYQFSDVIASAPGYGFVPV
jgi:hypothetical protein